MRTDLVSEAIPKLFEVLLLTIVKWNKVGKVSEKNLLEEETINNRLRRLMVPFL